MTNWWWNSPQWLRRLPERPIIRAQPLLFRKSVRGRRVAWQAAARCVPMTDVPVAQQWAVVAHSAVSDGGHGSLGAVASLHHRTQIAELMFAKSHRRKIARMMSLLMVTIVDD